MNTWPTQAGADAFYGNPRGHNGHASPAWEAANLVLFTPPFKMHFAGQPVREFRIHRKCAASLGRVFAAIWRAAGESQAKVDEWGASVFGGTYNFRPMRGSSHLSMHAYGCAIDLDPACFPMGASKRAFCSEVCTAFANEGWVNLAHDRMHFQAARLH